MNGMNAGFRSPPEFYDGPQETIIFTVALALSAFEC